MANLLPGEEIIHTSDSPIIGHNAYIQEPSKCM